MGRNANGEGKYRKIANGNWQNRIMCEYPTELGKIKYTSGQRKTKAKAHRIAIERKKAWDKAARKISRISIFTGLYSHVSYWFARTGNSRTDTKRY